MRREPVNAETVDPGPASAPTPARSGAPAGSGSTLDHGGKPDGGRDDKRGDRDSNHSDSNHRDSDRRLDPSAADRPLDKPDDGRHLDSPDDGRDGHDRGGDRQGGVRWRAPLVWRFMSRVAPGIVFPVCRLRVTGDLPAGLRDGPVIVAVNHIGPFDPAVVCAAFGTRGLAPRLMATGGLFRAPVVGSFMRACGHIRVNRRQADVAGAIDDVIVALRQGSTVVGYPEGRITLDPGMWPERGRTGLARIALRTGVPVVPVAQWGAHEVLAWGGLRPSLARACTALFRRPVVQVRFGPPVDLTGITDGTPGAAQRATDRIMDAIVAELVVLRVDEPRLPRYIDPVRPLSTARSHRRPPPGP